MDSCAQRTANRPGAFFARNMIAATVKNQHEAQDVGGIEGARLGTSMMKVAAIRKSANLAITGWTEKHAQKRFLDNPSEFQSGTSWPMFLTNVSASKVAPQINDFFICSPGVYIPAHHGETTNFVTFGLLEMRPPPVVVARPDDTPPCYQGT